MGAKSHHREHGSPSIGSAPANALCLPKAWERLSIRSNSRPPARPPAQQRQRPSPVRQLARGRTWQNSTSTARSRDVRGGGRHAAPVGDPRAGRPHRHEVRLRRRAVRRLLGAHQRRGAALLLDPRRRREGDRPDRHHRGPVAPTARTRCRRPGRRSTCRNAATASPGQIMAAAALLEEEAEADRRGHRRGDDQHLPLRHLPAHPRGRAHGGGNAASGGTATGPAEGVEEVCHDKDNPQQSRTLSRRKFIVGSAAARRRAGARLPPAVRHRRGRGAERRRAAPRSMPGS